MIMRRCPLRELGDRSGGPPPYRFARAGSGVEEVAGDVGGHHDPEVRVRRWCGDASPRCAHDETLLEEERLVDVLDRLGGLGDGDREGVEPDRLPDEPFAQHREYGAVDLV